jgi:FtsP/CotA-like multicopper oxidase with cupredoxin domain
MNRRRFLALGGAGALVGALGSVGLASAAGPGSTRGRIPRGIDPNPSVPVPTGVKRMALVATDGWVSMPKGSTPVKPWYPDMLAPAGTDTYVFGFRDVTGLSRAQAQAQKGVTQISAPLIFVESGGELWVTLSNLGLQQRPDLVDSHTIHWHGFRNAIPFYDGVPETSISVPIGSDMTYVYRPQDAGTYMYHCHFEDVEHVTMGMSGIVFVTPAGKPMQAYDDASTAFDRQYAIILTEIDSRAHFNDAHIQTTNWTDFTPTFWTMNGRAYPDTLAPNGTSDTDGTPLAPGGDEVKYGHLKHQPNSSLIVCAPGEKVLVRLASLGFQEHSLSLPGIPMRIVGSDSRYLGADTTSVVDTVDIGPGESRDVLFTAPSRPGVYPLFNRDSAKYAGVAGDQWSGGQRTHVVVKSGIGPQTAPNQWDPTWLA